MSIVDMGGRKEEYLLDLDINMKQPETEALAKLLTKDIDSNLNASEGQ